MNLKQKRTTKKYPWQRIAAFSIDCLFTLAWAGVLAVIVMALNAAGVLRVQRIDNILLANIVASLSLVVPITITSALLESSRQQATLGKRLFHLKVITNSGDSAQFRIALVRNILKVALPWTLGHAAVYEIIASSAESNMPASVIILTIGAYVLPIIYFASLFIKHGTTPYDKLLKLAVKIITTRNE